MHRIREHGAVTLDVTGLWSGYAEMPVILGTELEVEAAEIVVVLGENGAGKSTLLKTIIGTVPVLKGEIRLEGRRIESLPAHRRVAAGVGFSPEGRRVFPHLTAFENLIVGAQGVPSAELGEQAGAVYDFFPILSERRDQRAGTLSGGEQQMLAIGRALMSRPRLLMIEEPSQGLAPLVLDEVYGALRQLCRAGLAVLLVEQFQKYRHGYADRVLVLEKGRLVPAGAGTGVAFGGQ